MEHPIDDVETVFETNPFFENAWRTYKGVEYRKNTDEIVLMLAAIAFELNQIRRKSLNVDARIFDGDTEGWSE